MQWKPLSTKSVNQKQPYNPNCSYSCAAETVAENICSEEYTAGSTSPTQPGGDRPQLAPSLERIAYGYQHTLLRACCVPSLCTKCSQLDKVCMQSKAEMYRIAHPQPTCHSVASQVREWTFASICISSGETAQALHRHALMGSAHRKVCTHSAFKAVPATSYS